MKSSSINKSNNFAILHFIGACMVMYGHQWSLLGGIQPSILGCSVSNIGVKMIFVITGYLITQSFLRSEQFSDFMKRRLIRIFPALISCILLCTLLLSLLSSLDFKTYFRWSFSYILHNILLYPYYALPGVFENNPYPNAVNGSLWTLPVEIVMYFFIGITLWILCKFRKEENKKTIQAIYFIITLFFVLIEVYRFLNWSDKRLVIWGTDWIISLNLICYMMIGSLFEVCKLQKYCNLQVAAIMLFITLCINYTYSPLIALIVIPYFTMSFALSAKPVFSECFKKTNIAYGVFLWSFPVQQVIVYLLQVKLQYYFSPNIYFLISLFPVIFIAFLSHRFIETPIEGYLKKKLL